MIRSNISPICQKTTKSKYAILAIEIFFLSCSPQPPPHSSPQRQGEHTPYTSSQNTGFQPLSSTLLQTHPAVYTIILPSKDNKILPAGKKCPHIHMVSSSYPLPSSPIRCYLTVEILRVKSIRMHFSACSISGFSKYYLSKCQCALSDLCATFPCHKSKGSVCNSLRLRNLL